MTNTSPLAWLKAILLVGSGGFLGANVRHGVSTVVPGLAGTLLVNTVGCFVIGVVLYHAMAASGLGRNLRLVGTTGFLGSFTTYSTFALQTVQTPELALANVVASYAFGFAGVLGGRSVVRRLREGERR